MAQKTNKLAEKRLKVTGSGKVFYRTTRKNDQGAKSSGETKTRKKRSTSRLPHAEEKTILKTLLPNK